MKNDAACARLVSIEWTIRSTLGYMSICLKVANAMLTVTRAVDNLAGNPILLWLENTEDAKGSSSTHGKGFDNNEIDGWED